jgi:hypothetical protein
VEAVHIELPNEAVHLVVSEVTREYDLLEFIDVPYDELSPCGPPINNLSELFVLSKKNTTPSI